MRNWISIEKRISEYNIVKLRIDKENPVTVMSSSIYGTRVIIPTYSMSQGSILEYREIETRLFDLLDRSSEPGEIGQIFGVELMPGTQPL